MNIPELNQDDYSRGRPTFTTPSGGTLTVIGWKGRSGTSKIYVTYCNFCSRDPELFGDGSFSSVKGSLVKGCVPCGCSLNTKWTEKQNKVRISRQAKIMGFEFLGWVGDYKGNNTKLKLVCHKHGPWLTNSIVNFIRGHGCPSCKSDKTRKEKTQPEDLHIDAFISTGSFMPGTKFWRSKRSNKTGRLLYWNYTCPQCSHDDYVKAGLCSGVFESFVVDMKSGGLSCRCSKAYRWSQEQREYQIKKEIERRRDNCMADYSLSGWVTSYKNPFSKFKYICKEHGEQIIIVDRFLRGQGCPKCKGKTQRQAYINVVMDGDVPVAIKLGIANESPRRLRCQNSRNLFQMKNLYVFQFPTVESCKAAERECKAKLACGVLTSREMCDGWTETTSITNIGLVIEMYTSHGGLIINSTRNLLFLGDNSSCQTTKQPLKLPNRAA